MTTNGTSPPAPPPAETTEPTSPPLVMEPAPERALRLPAIAAGGRVQAIVPQSLDEAWRIAQMLAASRMVPADYAQNPQACMVAIMQGAELGLPPMQAIQSISVINGRPSLWGDAMLAVVRQSGLLEWIKETDENGTAVCVVKRRGDPEPVQRSFSMQDAERAGLASKGGPWKQYPARMRMFRARSWALRDTFGDVLKGMYSAEEAQDIPREPRDVTPVTEVRSAARPPSPPSPPSPGAAAVVEHIAAEETAPVAISVDEFLDRLALDMLAAPDLDSLGEVWLCNEAVIGEWQRADRDKATALYEKHEARIKGTV